MSMSRGTAVSAPGKVLLAGGYLVLDRAYTGLVFGLDARIHVVVEEIRTNDGVQLSEIVVESPQFLDAQWRYGYHLTDHDGGIEVTQLHVGERMSTNRFVETTLSFALTYISRIAQHRPTYSIKPSRLTIIADNDYYSQPAAAESTDAPSANRFSRFPTTLHDAHKTGLGSSAALVTTLTAALLTHYLDSTVFDLTTDTGKTCLHNLAQAAHCAAQGKVGSGFDIAAAVYGSCTYRRFSPNVLASLPAVGSTGFARELENIVSGKDSCKWDTDISEGVCLPAGVAIRMCDVDCGSKTVGMVKKVLQWRKEEPEAARCLWDELQHNNEELARVLREGATDQIRPKVLEIRRCAKKMGTKSGVPIEPDSQTELLQALESIDGVLAGVVPGAGGFDALALLVADDSATSSRIGEFLKTWSKKKGVKVSLMGVKGEMEGLRMEAFELFKEWLSPPV